MDFVIPGTIRSIPKTEAGHIEDIFQSMFLPGELTLRQVADLTGLETYDIQNWVKRGFLSPPQRKRYNLNQVCRILNINTLKGILQMETICGLLGYINGHLDDTSDDIIGDAELYFIFVRLASGIGKIVRQPEELDPWITEALQDYQEPVSGAKDRVKQVLQIMLTAWAAARLRQYAEGMIQNLNQ